MNRKLWFLAGLIFILLVIVIPVNATIVSDFTTNTSIGYAPLTVQFTDTSTGVPTSWVWKFRDIAGNNTWTQFSTDENPIYAFPEGLYDINLTATNLLGSDDEIKNWSIGANWFAADAVEGASVYRDVDGTFYQMRDGVGTGISRNHPYEFNTFLWAAPSNKWDIDQRAIISFDASPVPDDAIKDSAFLNLFGYYKEATEGVPSLSVIDVNPSNPLILTKEDYNETTWSRMTPDISFADWKTQYDTYPPDWNYNAWNNLTLNTAGKSHISLTTPFSYMISNQWEVDNTTTGLVWYYNVGSEYTTMDFYGTGQNNTRAQDLGWHKPYIKIHFEAPVGETIITTYPLQNETQILPYDDSNLPLPGLNLSINATRNEYKQTSFVIKPNSTISDINIVATELTDGAGHTIPTNTLDIKTIKVWYQSGSSLLFYDQPMYNIDATPEFHLVPELILNNDSIISCDYTNQNCSVWIKNATFEGYFKIDNTTIGTFPTDALIYDNATAGFPQPFALDTNENKQILIIAHIPSAQTSGDYTGKIWINSSTTSPLSMNLSIRVLPFDLTSPSLINGIYYTALLRGASYQGVHSSTDKDTTQYTADLANMLDHGASYPTIYQSNDSYMNSALSLRSTSGLPLDKIYMLWNDVSFTDNSSSNINTVGIYTSQIKAKTISYGFGTNYIYGIDEPTTDQMITETPLLTVVQNNGSMTFASTNPTLYNMYGTLGNLMDQPNIATSNNSFNSTELNKWAGITKKATIYNNPQSGLENPERYRMNYGFRLWVSGYNGSMIFAYQKQHGQSIWNDYDTPTGKYRDFAFTYPATDHPIDTLQWEGYREGINDARYADKLTAVTGSKIAAITIINDGITAGKDASSIRNDLIEAILTAGCTIADHNPVYTFNKSGNYNVSLTVTNNAGSSTKYMIIEVDEVGITPPTPEFICTPLIGAPNLIVECEDKSINYPDDWSWDFGDGNVSTIQHANNTYDTVGFKTISLNVSNAGGYNVETKTNYINVTYAYAPVASYYAYPVSGTRPLTVNFTDTSTNTPTSWLWDFGEGNTSIEQNPYFTYEITGIYYVNLTATNPAGSSSAINTINTIDTLPNIPIVNFTILGKVRSDIISIQFPGRLIINDTSTETPSVDINWADGTANDTDISNIVHQYTKRGVFNMSYTVTNPSGTNTTYQKIRVMGYQGFAAPGSECKFTSSRQLAVSEYNEQNCKICGVCEK